MAGCPRARVQGSGRQVQGLARGWPRVWGLSSGFGQTLNQVKGLSSGFGVLRFRVWGFAPQPVRGLGFRVCKKRQTLNV